MHYVGTSGVVAGRLAHWVFRVAVPTSKVVRSRPGPELDRTHTLVNYLQSPVVEVRFVATPSPQKLSPALDPNLTFHQPLTLTDRETPCDNHHHLLLLLHRRHGQHHISLTRSPCSHGPVDLQRNRVSMLCDFPGRFKGHWMHTIVASQWSSTTPPS